MTKLAKETGMTRAGLYKAPSKDGNPSFDTIVKAMRRSANLGSTHSWHISCSRSNCHDFGSR
jgi:DNA-binding phage protein